MNGVALAIVAVVLCAACDGPAKPQSAVDQGQPAKIEDFDVLFRSQCAGCHGEEGRGGPALGLANPIYLAMVDEATLRRITAAGVAGTSMPAFAGAQGGMLTDRQVDVIARGIRARWRRPAEGVTPPPYASPPGDVARGAAVYQSHCASCHGGGGAAAGDGGILDGSFLALVSPQGLRTTIIAGRPDLGHPDWRNDRPGDPLSSQQIADVVAWMLSHRPEFPGQPYSPTSLAP
jgi:cytochrome c oxidase cbb3-type subunit 3/ubiquinol-cytochrome c reductase cytochrome c subunit